MYIMTEKDHGSGEMVVYMVGVLVRGEVAMYLKRASGMPHARLRSGREGMVHERDVVEMHAGANLMWFFTDEGGEDESGDVREVRNLALSAPVIFHVLLSQVMLHGDVIVGDSFFVVAGFHFG